MGPTVTSKRPRSVTVILRGGLGNQLFQYAAAWGLVGEQGQDRITLLSYGSEWGPEHPDIHSLIGVEVRYPHRGYRMRLPGVAVRESWKDAVSASAATLLGGLNSTRLVRQSDPFLPRDLPRARHVVLDGFFQHRSWWSESWRWVAARISAVAPPGLAPIRLERRTALKVRRSDYLGRGIVLNDDYYRHALGHLQVRGQKVSLVTEDADAIASFTRLLSDFDCTVRMPEPVTGNPNLDDFWHLAAARTQVLANSSYCWWAAAVAQFEEPGARAAYPDPWLPNAWSEGPVPDMGLTGWTPVSAEFM